MASFSSRSSYSSSSPMRNSMLMSSQGNAGFQGSGVGGGSVYGGAGGYGVRISQASSMNNALNINEKATMQDLNGRLASYLEKVGTLERANAELELKIRRYLETKLLPEGHDFSSFYLRIADLQKEIALASRANSSIFLSIDNAKLAADDFKLKYDNEHAMHQMVEADILGLKGVKDDLVKTRVTLESEIEALKLELLNMKRVHEEDLLVIRSQLGGQVNVEVDAAPQQDLSVVMDEIRRHYEGVAEKNHKELEAWFQTKTNEINSEVSDRTLSLQSTKSEVTEVRRLMENLEIELQSQLSMIDSLRNNLGDVKNRYGNMLAGYQRQVSGLEEQLGDLRASLAAQAQQYQMLLDIKTRLELEIAEYRRLMDGEQYSTTETRKVVIEKHTTETGKISG